MRYAGVLSASAILIFALAIAITGVLRTNAQLKASFAQQRVVQQAQLTLERMLKIEIDEENYIRAYVITRDRSYIDSYQGTSVQFDAEQAQLQRALSEEHLRSALAALRDYAAAHRNWQREVAAPMLKGGAAASQLDARGKIFIDTQSDDAQYIEALLAVKSSDIARSSQEAIEGTLSQRIAWLVAFGVVALLLNTFRSRASRQLEEERVITQTLQRAFRSAVSDIPHCTVATAYAAAGRHFAVGGDVFDVYALSDRIALALIADVSGKGVDAAVLTTFIKFTVRGIALRQADPAAILDVFNSTFERTVRDPSLFVSMLVGLLDTQTLEFRYASAGHDSSFLKRSNIVEQLDVTGPVLGVLNEPYRHRSIQLAPGDMLVLATDGLTEARDRRGAFLGDEGAGAWIEQESSDPSQLTSGLIARLRRLEGNALHDDVAILAIRADGRG